MSHYFVGMRMAQRFNVWVSSSLKMIENPCSYTPGHCLYWGFWYFQSSFIFHQNLKSAKLIWQSSSSQIPQQGVENIKTIHFSTIFETDKRFAESSGTNITFWMIFMSILTGRYISYYSTGCHLVVLQRWFLNQLNF